MSKEALKEQARRLEQREEWAKALEVYAQVIRKQEGSDDPDIALHNRVGDLHIRMGDVAEAVDSYETAIDLYLEAELPNNAVAICRKIIRNDPTRAAAFLRLGRLRAEQGFVVDARENFLSYAELMQARGKSDAAFGALEEFVELAPQDVDTRLFVAEQLVARERSEDALAHFSQAYVVLSGKGEEEGAAKVLERIHAIDPDHPVPDPSVAEPALAETGADEAGGLEGFESTHLGGDEIAASEEAEPADDEGDELGFADISFGDDDDEAEAAEALPTFEDPEETEEAVPASDLGGFELEVPRSEEDAEEEAVPTADFGDFELETLALEEGAAEEEEAEPLPTMDLGGDEGQDDIAADTEEFADPLPTVDFGEDEEPEGDPADIGDFELAVPAGDEGDGRVDEEDEPLPTIELEGPEDEVPSEAELERAHPLLAERGLYRDAIGTVQQLLRADPDRIELHRRAVEYAHETDDRAVLVEAFLELAEALARRGERAKADAVFERVLSLDSGNARARQFLGRVATAGASPPATEAFGGPADEDDEYVDLASLVLDDDEEASTRWVVVADEPTGDEQADFSRMLSQFKEKVSQNLAQDDAKAHYDLGMAYKEMGLLEEAIGEFQLALKARPDNLPTVEMLGHCFLEKGEPAAAIRTLERGLDLPVSVEDELLGVYYFLGRAYERTGSTESAKEFYDKIFALDINFEDVTERLRALR